MIETKGLTRKYGNFTAVDNVSFNIAPGEIIGLLGHNGAGKTTIMKMLTGFLEPTAGTILINGMNMAERRPAIQAKIGYLPENCPLYPEMTVIDYLEYAAGLRGVADSEKNQSVRRVIERAGLREKAGQSINTLSRGYRQRVGVAQAILNNPEILILDEPTNGLDPSQIQHMRTLVREFGHNSTVIISTHILQEVEAVCDRVLIIRAGRLALDSTLQGLRDSHRLLLSIDKGLDNACGRLSQIKGISGVERISGNGAREEYALSIDNSVAGAEVGELAPLVAKTVIEQGGKLYALHPETRDLETVFREINAADGVSEGGAINAD